MSLHTSFPPLDFCQSDIQADSSRRVHHLFIPHHFPWTWASRVPSRANFTSLLLPHHWPPQQIVCSNVTCKAT